MTLTKIKHRKLGNSSLEVSPIGIGVMQFAGGVGMFNFMYSDIPQGQKDEIVKTALELGVNWFDTAELYGRGRSERTLSLALQNNNVSDGEVRIATKWWPAPRTARNIKKTIDTRLRYLNGYTIDLYQVHWPYSFSSPEAEMEEMADLVEQGKIKTVGVSNFSAAYMRRAQAALARRGLGLASNQVQFSLINRKIETDGILDTAKELGVSIIAWSPIGIGLLTGKYHKTPEILKDTPIGKRMRVSLQLSKTQPLIDAMDEMAQNHGVTIAQVALNWAIHFHGETIVAIPGASKPQHAREAAEVMYFRLTDEEMSRLDQLTRQYR